MDMLKRVLAVLGAAFGLLALFYLVFACSLTLKNFGLSVEAQLIVQQILTPLLFVALAALAVSCEYFRRVLLQSGIKAGILLRILRLIAVVVLPVVIVIFTLQTPFWSFQSPASTDGSCRGRENRQSRGYTFYAHSSICSCGRFT